MVRAVERDAVTENQPHVRYKLFCDVVTRIVGVGVRLGRVGRHQLALDGAEIHRVLDDARVMGNIKSDRVNGPQERGSVLELLKRAYCGQTESVLCSADRRYIGTHRRRRCCGWTRDSGVTIGLDGGRCNRRGRASLQGRQNENKKGDMQN